MRFRFRLNRAIRGARFEMLGGSARRFSGCEPPDLTVITVARRLNLPMLWSAQEQTVGVRVERKVIESLSLRAAIAT